jgi:IMP dehydrogenase/GMP reductase
MRLVQKALTFDDVLLVPAYSAVLPRDVQLSTKLSRNISLNIPLVSAAMDTVTEARLAIALAQEGGIGIIHKNITPKEQAAQVIKVKRHEAGVLRDPITVTQDMTVRDAIELQRTHKISGLPVVEGKRVVGIVTNRDLRFETRHDARIREIMTPRPRLVTVPEGASLEDAKALMHKHRLERVLVITGDDELRGLVTVKDITKATEHPLAAKDALGNLRVGGAISTGPDSEERAELMVKAGVDVLIVEPRTPSPGRAESGEGQKNFRTSMSSAAMSRRRRQHAHWSMPVPTASRSASGPARSARRGSWPAWACRRLPRCRTLRSHLPVPGFRSSLTAESVIRATFQRRLQRARIR